MAKNDKARAKPGKGTPSASDRKVIERAGQPVSGDTPDVGATGGGKIKPVDLSLHGNGVDHWQDEPISARKARRQAKEGGPRRSEK
jgi:hypothetical protein